MAPALAIAVLQLGQLICKAIRRPRLDREAHDHRKALVAQTRLRQVHLVEVGAAERVNRERQYAHPIDHTSGLTHSIWFSPACFPTGTLVLIDVQPGRVRTLDWMLPDELHAANRHRQRAAVRGSTFASSWERDLVRHLGAGHARPPAVPTRTRGPATRAA